MLLPPVPLIYRKRRGRTRAKRKPNFPVLMLALYDPKVSIVLGFDREIDVSGMDGSQIVITDGALTSSQYAATGTVTQTAPNRVRIRLNDIAHFEGTGIVLNVSAANGIVAVGGGAWGGCTDLQLPYAP
jgi:hypothetical protein